MLRGAHRTGGVACRARGVAARPAAAPRRRPLIERRLGEPPQRVNRRPIGHHRVRRQQRARWLIHERHELVGNPGIVQPMQMPPTFGHPPMPPIQPRLPTLHCTTGPQQPSFTMHSREPVLGELRLLVVAAAVAALVHRLTEQPGRTQPRVERNHRRAADAMCSR